MFATPAWWFSPGSFGIGDVTAALARQDELELALMASQLGHDEAMSRLDPQWDVVVDGTDATGALCCGDEHKNDTDFTIWWFGGS